MMRWLMALVLITVTGIAGGFMFAPMSMQHPDPCQVWHGFPCAPPNPDEEYDIFHDGIDEIETDGAGGSCTQIYGAAVSLLMEGKIYVFSPQDPTTYMGQHDAHHLPVYEDFYVSCGYFYGSCSRGQNPPPPPPLPPDQPLVRTIIHEVAHHLGKNEPEAEALENQCS